MPNLTITALQHDVSVQDPFPAEGSLVLKASVGSPVSREIPWSQLQRLAAQLESLEASGLATYTVTSGTVDERFSESDLVGLPMISSLNLATTPLQVDSAITSAQILGTGFVGNQVKASVVMGTASAANGHITFTAVRPGADGNDISITFVGGGGGGSGAVVSVVGNDITVTLETGVATFANIETAINAHADAKYLVLAAKGGTGVTVAVAEAQTYLEGGEGDGVTLTIAGNPADIVSISNTVIVYDIDLTGESEGDMALVELRSGSKLATVQVALGLGAAYPEIKSLDTGTTALDVGGAITGAKIAGANLLAAQSAASAVMGDTEDDNGFITFTAVKPGVAGNDITVTFAGGGGGGSGAAVAVVGNDITVTLEEGVATYSDVETAVNADTDALLLVQAVKGGTGATAAAVEAETALEGGVGAGLTVTVGSFTADVTAASDTEITYDVDLTTATAADTVAVTVKSGKSVASISTVLTSS